MDDADLVDDKYWTNGTACSGSIILLLCLNKSIGLGDKALSVLGILTLVLVFLSSRCFITMSALSSRDLSCSATLQYGKHRQFFTETYINLLQICQKGNTVHCLGLSLTLIIHIMGVHNYSHYKFKTFPAVYFHRTTKNLWIRYSNHKYNPNNSMCVITVQDKKWDCLTKSLSLLPV